MYNPAGEEQTIGLADGRDLTLGRLTVAVLRAWRAWIAELVGDPFADAERWLGKVPAEESLRQIRAAEDLRDQMRYFSLATPLAQHFFSSELGQAKLFQLLLQKHHPKATEEDGLAVALELARRHEVKKALDRAQGLEGPAPAGEGGEGNAEAPA